MSNSLETNPIKIDTAVEMEINQKEPLLVMGFSWIDDATAAGGAVAQGNSLDMKINGCAFSVECSSTWPQIWVTGFTQPFRLFTFEVVVIDGGSLLVWLA
jgi:hypothetical protein